MVTTTTAKTGLTPTLGPWTGAFRPAHPRSAFEVGTKIGREDVLKRIRTEMLIAALFTLAVLAVSCGGQAADQEGSGGGGGSGETVTVASSVDYKPFEFFKNERPVGFDIDLMNEIGKRAGFRVEYRNVGFDGIIPGLGNNLYDAAIAAMIITKERSQQVDFSQPYFNADKSLLVQSDSDIQSFDDLTDATVGVQIGTTGAKVADEMASQGKIGQVRTFDTFEDAFVALENGQVQAVLNDFPVLAYRAKASDGRLEVVGTIPTDEQYGIAFPKGSDLRQPVNEALAEIKEDGTYAEIYEKWFGEEPKNIP
jgi:ABC-type amino acid transport substrate-binding protein